MEAGYLLVKRNAIPDIIVKFSITSSTTTLKVLNSSKLPKKLAQTLRLAQKTSTTMAETLNEERL